MLDEFARERAANIAWLRSVENAPAPADWSVAHHHPKFGPIAAGDLLAAWAAHDALHLRQIAKRLFELSLRDGAPFTTRYAGDWGVWGSKGKCRRNSLDGITLESKGRTLETVAQTAEKEK